MVIPRGVPGVLLALVLLVAAVDETHAQQQETLYCGADNCYEIIGAAPDATDKQIRKAYKTLARKLHPDRNKASDATEKFIQLANAYEILSNEESRKEYDYYLEHPEDVLYNQYTYYKRRLSPKVDIRIVFFWTITIISLLQYFVRWKMYDQAMNGILVYDTRTRQKMITRAIDHGFLKANYKKQKMKTEEVTQKLIECAEDGHMELKGGWKKPKWSDILWAQIVMSPYRFCMYLKWNWDWHYKHNVLKLDYNEEEQYYLTYRALKYSVDKFDCLEESERNSLIARKLWIKENLTQFNDEKVIEEREALASSGRRRRYARWLKQNPDGDPGMYGDHFPE